MRRDPSKLNYLTEIPDCIEGPYCVDKDILARRRLRVPDRLDGSLVVSEDSAVTW